MLFGSGLSIVVVVCVVLAVLGLFVFSGRLSKFGRLPGDFRHGGRRVKVFVPFTSMLVLSIVLSVLLTLLSWLFG